MRMSCWMAPTSRTIAEHAVGSSAILPGTISQTHVPHDKTVNVDLKSEGPDVGISSQGEGRIGAKAPSWHEIGHHKYQRLSFVKAITTAIEGQRKNLIDALMVVWHGAHLLRSFQMLQTFSKEQGLSEERHGLTKGASQQRVLAGGAPEDEPKQWREAMRAGEGCGRRNLYIPLLQRWIGAYPYLAPTDSLSASNTILDNVSG